MSRLARLPRPVRADNAVVTMLNSTLLDGVSSVARLALLLLAYRMWQTDKAQGLDRYAAFPSLARLSREMGACRNTTKRSLRELSDAGLLEIDGGGRAARPVKGVRTRAHVFRLGPAMMRQIDRQWPNEAGELPALRVVGDA